MDSTPQPTASPASSSPSATAFDRLPLAPAQLSNLQQLGYQAMTPIQAASLPLTLAGHDLIAQAKTGSGKTCAFALPLLANLDPSRFAVQAMVLCPTRELSEQVTQEIRRLARAADNIKVLSLVGGSPMRPQITSLEHGAHIVVGTPGRLMDHLQRESLNLDALNTLVLDEADRMLDMGFLDAIQFVARRCPKKRQTLLFSATYPDGIEKLAKQFLQQPKSVKLTEQHAQDKIRQRFYEIAPEQRLDTVVKLLNHFRPVSTLAFCNTRQQCRDLLEVLRRKGFEALALHGELDQHQRNQVMAQFANRSCSVLVATDVAARGLDIADLECVINVDVTPDPEVYIHRIGRTGRADRDGWALSLVATNQMPRINAILEATHQDGDWQAVSELVPTAAHPLLPPMTTVQILAGRKDKIRAGDVLGALTGEAGLTAEQVGKIDIDAFQTYVAIARGAAQRAVQALNSGKIKGKAAKARLLDNADSALDAGPSKAIERLRSKQAAWEAELEAKRPARGGKPPHARSDPGRGPSSPGSPKRTNPRSRRP